MTIKTAIVGLLQYAQGDDMATYLERWLPQSLRLTDALFDPASGHNHSGSGASGGPLTNLGVGGYLQLAEIAATPATPAAGRARLYVKTDHHLYFLNSAGTETLIV